MLVLSVLNSLNKVNSSVIYRELASVVGLNISTAMVIFPMSRTPPKQVFWEVIESTIPLTEELFTTFAAEKFF